MSNCYNDEEEDTEEFLGPLDFLNPFSECNTWIYWIIIGVLIFIIIMMMM